MEPTARHEPTSESHTDIVPTPEYFPELATLLLHLPADVLNSGELSKLADEHDMIVKQEFHITVIGHTNGQKILEALSRTPKPKKIAKTTALKELIQATNWQVELLPEGYELHSVDEENETLRRSVVEMARVKGLEDFMANLNQLLGTDIATQPPHVTLCTAGSLPEKSKMGIGVYTEDDLNSYQKKKILLGSDLMNK